MTTKSILIRKEKETGKVISQQLLFDDETTQHIIISDLPEIHEKEGFSGHYIVSETGEVKVEYIEMPKTEIEILNEKLLDQEKIIADLILMVAGGNK